MSPEKKNRFFKTSDAFLILLIVDLLVLKTFQDLREHEAIYKAQFRSSEFVLVGKADTLEECFSKESDPADFPWNVDILVSLFPELDPRSEAYEQYVEAIDWWDPYADQTGLRFRPDVDGDGQVCGVTYHFTYGQAVRDFNEDSS